MTTLSVPIKAPSTIGPLWVTLSETSVLRLGFGKVRGGKITKGFEPLWKKVQAQLLEYFAGERRDFDLPLDPPGGTPFQRAIWEALREIPYGQVISYGDLAAWAGRQKAGRAAGSACGANPIAVLVPCHRVVARGGLGGYGGGLEAKRFLLDLERGAPE
jgi:methylated-DNA-[protein]-cysteine S-methyltransferase